LVPILSVVALSRLETVAYRKIRDPERLYALCDAVLSVGSDLSLPSVLERIVQSACALADARYGALGVLDRAGKGLEQFLHVGVDQETVDAIGHLPEGHGILGLLIVEPRALRLEDLTEHPESHGFPEHHPFMKSFLGVPIRIRDEVFGNLYLTEKMGSEQFSAEDEELVGALAAAAGIAIENARLLSRLRDHTLLEDRDRIARDLHDTVIQRLFAIGLQLEGATRIGVPDLTARIEQAVEDIDDTIRQIRTTIFELESASTAVGTREHVAALAREMRPILHHPVHLRFEGPVDTSVSEALRDHLMAALREALTNVAKHAHATRVDVLVRAGDQLELEVLDDGVGRRESDSSSGRGVANLAARAQSLGGDAVIMPRQGGGTAVLWHVPLT
jgi:signal transduction histidine kinase